MLSPADPIRWRASPAAPGEGPTAALPRPGKVMGKPSWALPDPIPGRRRDMPPWSSPAQLAPFSAGRSRVRIPPGVRVAAQLRAFRIFWCWRHAPGGAGSRPAKLRTPYGKAPVERCRAARQGRSRRAALPSGPGVRL